MLYNLVEKQMASNVIMPKILLEKLIRTNINKPVREIEVYCFNAQPKIFVNVKYGKLREISVYDENFKQINLILHPDRFNKVIVKKPDFLIKQTFDLSKILSNEFLFTRIDWIISNKKLYFNEMTFSPYSGMMKFDKFWNKKMGSWIKICS